ncbi:MAG: molecular chaperone DnaJ, partial [Atopobiaceae bacterium]|nr:molecular chaperone DnaJ [Atopobiaceae bacterium]
CPDCGGLGQVVDHPCETCDGQGRTPSREKIEIEIPAGIRSGQRLVREGFGEAGIRGEASGDLVLAIEVEKHNRFAVQGEDLHINTTISAFQAMLGCTLSLDGILADERLELEVPAGCQNGDRVRLSGGGMPRMGSSARGDLIATIAVEIPRDLSLDERDAIEALAEGREEPFGDELFEVEFAEEAEVPERKIWRPRWPWERP